MNIPVSEELLQPEKRQLYNQRLFFLPRLRREGTFRVVEGTFHEVEGIIHDFEKIG